MLLEEALEIAGITPDIDVKICKLIRDRNTTARELVHIFKALKAISASPREHSNLYCLAIGTWQDVNLLAKTFKALKGIGATLKEHLILFETSVKKMDKSNKLDLILKKLNEAGFTVEDDMPLYEMMLSLGNHHLEWLDEIIETFKKLKDAGLPLIFSLGFTRLIEQPFNHKSYVPICKVFQQLGLSFVEYSNLYDFAFCYLVEPVKLTRIFEVLNHAGASYKDNLMFYAKAIEDSRYSVDFYLYLVNDLTDLYELLNGCGFTLKEHTTLYYELMQLRPNLESFTIKLKQLLDVGVANKDYELFTNIVSDGDKVIAILNMLKENGVSPEYYLKLYKLITRDKCDIKKTDNVLKALNRLGATLKHDWVVYEKAIENARYANEFDKIFDMLKGAGLTLEGHQMLYEKAIENAGYANEFDKIFDMLKGAGLTLEGHQMVYEKAIENARYANEFDKIFETLKQEGFLLEREPSVYIAVLSECGFSSSMAIMACKALLNAGIKENEYPTLYVKGIKSRNGACNLDKIFSALKEAGATLTEHADLYAVCLDEALYGDEFHMIFNALLDAGVSLQTDPALYKATIHDYAQDGNRFAILSKALTKVGVTITSYLKLHRADIHEALSYAKEFSTVFEALYEEKITAQEHPALYDASIKNVRYAKQFPTLFQALHEAKITVQEHPALYDASIKNVRYAEQFSTLFQALHEVKITVQEYPVLYETAIKNASDAEQLSTLFQALHEVKITVQEHPLLYEAGIKNAFYARNFSTLFKALNEVKITVQEHPAIYEVCINNACDAEHIILLLQKLKGTRITAKDHPKLYERCIQNAYYAEKLTAALKILEAPEMIEEAGPATYEMVIDNAYKADSLVAQFKILQELGASQKDHQSLYALVAQENQSSISSCLMQIKSLGLKVPGDLRIIERAICQSKLALEIFTWLNANKMTVKNHYYIYDACFLAENAFIRDPYNWFEFKTKLEDYLKIHPLSFEEADSKQNQDIKALIQQLLNDDLTEGPLNKSPATLGLEAILERFPIVGPEKINMRYDNSLGYILKFYDEPEIYLSDFLRLANFNHINLSKDLIESLGEIIYAFSSRYDLQDLNTLLAENAITNKLPDAAKYALKHYIGEAHYMNINRLSRGVELMDEPRRVWIQPVNGSPNLIVNFLAGCLVNWAAAELPRIVISTEERIILEKILSKENDPHEKIRQMSNDQTVYKEILDNSLRRGDITEDDYSKVVICFEQLSGLFPIYQGLNRAENTQVAELTKEQQNITNRSVNSGPVPSATSYSNIEKGSPYFTQANVNSVLAISLNRPVINSTEGEIVIPAGTSFKHSRTPYGFFTKEVNSPAVVPPGGVWSGAALAEAYKQHLAGPYKDTTSEIQLGNKTIYRPNHGLAHTHRVMLYVPVVIHFLAIHAKDKVFRSFCQSIQPEQLEWLLVAAAFSVTGRESEIAALENLVRYEEFREFSMVNMKTFLEKYPPKNQDPLMQKRMLEIVRWMGNPGYETSLDGRPPINQESDLDERNHRNYFYRILSIAHKLDLVRCYNHEQFREVMYFCQKFTEMGESSTQVDYLRMVGYAVDLNRAHGNALYTCLSTSGELVSCAENYRPPFDDVSTNLRLLRAFSNSVKCFECWEPYQYSESPKNQ